MRSSQTHKRCSIACRTCIGKHEWGKTYKDGTPKTAAEVAEHEVRIMAREMSF
ncbi:MAG: hypothetical protein MJE12_19015 [Alphaproteobacteria bacterium]|nr:hypothetical protein [Alphaproteobacteria bacterium]